MRHELKTWPEYFRALRRGVKPFEIRNDDRNFQVGDILVLREWEPDLEEYSGEVIEREVTYVTRNAYLFGLRHGFVVMGVTPIDSEVAI